MTPPSTSRDVQAQRDARELQRFGYAQELLRSMGGFSNFAISFSIISILTGAVTLFDYGLKMGGPLEMTLGWPLATIGTLFVALSMAELCSALPTSGGTYHWSAELGGPTWAWFTALLNIVGLVTVIAGIDYGCAQFLTPILGLAALIERLRQLLTEVGIPSTLGALGVTRDLIPLLARKAMEDACHQSNPRPCTEADMIALYEKAL